MKFARLLARLGIPALRQGGYTIIEVMAFLAISAAIFASAQLLFKGQQSKTQFEQGVHDFVSSIQQSVDQVGASIFPGQSSYSCSIDSQSNRPVLSSGGGTSSGCIYLGNAFQVIPGQGGYWTYTVLGDRADSQGNVITSLSLAMPTPVVNSGSSNITLTTNYATSWGRVISSNVDYQSGGSGSTDLVGFYNSLGGSLDTGATGGQSIVAKSYSFASTNTSSVNSTGLVNCLEETGGCANPPIISDWKLCVANSSGSGQTALITLVSTPSGIAVNTNFTTCS